MPTRNIVPNANNEGSLGTATKRWADGHFEELHVGDGSVIVDAPSDDKSYARKNGTWVENGGSNQIVSGGDISDLTSSQQDSVIEGTIVTTTDGRRWVYSGAGDKTDEASYVELADVTPEWEAIAGKPSEFDPAYHAHNIGDINGLENALDEAGGSAVSVTVGRSGSGSDYECSGTLGSPTDHVVIQAAINSIASTGGVVSIREGVYFLGATINITVPNISVEGSGRATELRCVGDYGNVFLCALPQVPTTWPGMSGLQFSNLRFETTVERTSGAAIRANYTHNAIFRDLYICDCTYGVSYYQPGTYPNAGKAFYNGIYLDGQNQCHISKVTSCCVNRCVHINGSGYANADFSYDGYIENCNFWGAPGTRRGTGIYLGANCGGFVVDFCSLNQFEYAIYANATGTSQGGGIFTIRGGYAENDDHGYSITGYQTVVVEQLWGRLHVIGGGCQTTVLGVPRGNVVVDGGTALIYGNPQAVTGTGTWQVINTQTAASSGVPSYSLRTSNFTATAGTNYAVNTTSGPVEVTLPATPQVGQNISFADARGTWGTNSLIIQRNGNPIEGGTSPLLINSSGVSFTLLYVDTTVGWRVLASGTLPLNVSAPVLSGTSTFATTNGAWTGSPSSFAYKWQMSTNGTTWTDISGQTTSSYTNTNTADQNKLVRVGVSATNSFGTTAFVFSNAQTIAIPPAFPTANLVAFWRMSSTAEYSGNSAYTLTNTNSTAFASGLVGNAAVANGSSKLSATPFSLTFANGPVTISFWVRITNTRGGYNVLIGNNPGLNIARTNTGQLDINNFQAAGFVSVNTIPLNAWVHIVIIFNSPLATLYINGVQDGTTRNTNAVGTARLDMLNVENYLWDGALDAVGVWTRALTASEVVQLYNNGNGLEP